MPYTERPDLASRSAATQNEAYFPNEITEFTPTFNAPKETVYVYNVSGIEFNVPRPPNHPHLLIRKCPAKDEYLLVGQVEHPFPQVDYDQNGRKRIEYTDGYREATVMLSPMNPGTNQNFDAPDQFNVGGNLNNFGVFWSKHNPPLPQELAAARARMEKTYKEELAILAALEARNPDEARGRANDISHAAATYFGQSTSWHRSDLIPKQTGYGKINCPNCDEFVALEQAVCQHCNAVLDEEKARKLFPDRFRGAGRAPKEQAEAA